MAAGENLWTSRASVMDPDKRGRDSRWLGGVSAKRPG
jgi:hypothetical protein